ncbi:hypothetical protein Misp05_08780 [Micromonospora sp. NBRC 107095]|nr:hypothetical protein Misp05_08780 [Micromonospora sp. NBRC 107095]
MTARIRGSQAERVPSWRRSALFFLCASLLVLAIVEVRALAVVAGANFVRPWTVMFILAIMVAFVAPALDALPEASPVKREELLGVFRSRRARPGLLLSIVGLLVVLLNLLVVVLSAIQ